MKKQIVSLLLVLAMVLSLVPFSALAAERDETKDQVHVTVENNTYSVEDGVIHAQLTSDLEQTAQPWDFRITAQSGGAELEMDYQDMTIYWVYGDQEPPANETDSK